MGQNPEVLNRAISDALKKVDGTLRLRGMRILILGGAIFLLFFAPAVFKALQGTSQPIYISGIVAISVLIMIYGSILLLFGTKARSFYQRLMNKGSSVRVIAYAMVAVLFVCLTFLFHSFFSQFSK